MSFVVPRAGIRFGLTGNLVDGYKTKIVSISNGSSESYLLSFLVTSSLSFLVFKDRKCFRVYPERQTSRFEPQGVV